MPTASRHVAQYLSEHDTAQIDMWTLSKHDTEQISVRTEHMQYILNTSDRTHQLQPELRPGEYNTIGTMRYDTITRVCDKIPLF